MRRWHLALCVLLLAAFLAHQVSATESDYTDTDFVMSGEAKTSWPELVGLPASEAKAAIESERPDVTVQVVSQFAAVTMDYRFNRVRVFVNDDQTVARAPTTG